MKVVLFSVVIAMAEVYSGCGGKAAAGDRSERESGVPSVAVAKAALGDISRKLALTAEFKPYQEVDVMAKVAGYVKTISVDVGDRVHQGQVLAVLEIPEMAADVARGKAAMDRSQAEVGRARDELSRAESAHQLAHLSFRRLNDVAHNRAGLVAEQEVDDMHSKDLVSEAQVNAAKSSLAAAEEQVRVNAAELKRVETMMAYAQVVAPFAGVVTKRYADTGSMVQAGTASSTQALPVVRVSQNELLRLVLPVPEPAVPSIHPGQQVEVRVPSLNRSFQGRVARCDGKVSAATRTMETQVEVPNPALVLVPGMYAEVNLMLENKRGALTIPVQAADLSSDESHAGVITVSPQNTLFARTIEVGIESPAGIEVRSGLNEGDLVVVGNRAGLKAGQRVQPKLVGN